MGDVPVSNQDSMMLQLLEYKQLKMEFNILYWRRIICRDFFDVFDSEDNKSTHKQPDNANNRYHGGTQ